MLQSNNNMKKAIIALAILIAATGTTTTAFAHDGNGKKGQKKTTKAKTYTCPMHSEVTSSKPGKCPKCGMKLEVAKSEKK